MTDKHELRSTIFRHLDGLATAPVAIALQKKGVLDYLLEQKEATLAELTTTFKANEGYLNVGLRILASQGFLDYEVDNAKQEIRFACNGKSAIAFLVSFV
jgi:hypothetical protein